MVEAGVHDAIIRDMTEEDGQYGAQIKFICEMQDLMKDSGDLVQQWAWASATLSPKSKLWKWLKNVTGQTPTLGAPFDVTAAMIGKPVQLIVSFNDETQRTSVTDMLAAKKSGAQAPRPAQSRPAPAAQAAPEDQQESVGPCVSCGEPGDRYTGKGKPICGECAG